MNESDLYYLYAIGVMGAATALTRFLPFVFLNRHHENRHLNFVGRLLPGAATIILVVYCLKGTNFSAPTFGIPEAVAVIFTASMHVWKRNALLSIFGGTAIYLLLLRAF